MSRVAAIAVAVSIAAILLIQNSRAENVGLPRQPTTPEWSACLRTPTRACILDQATQLVLSAPDNEGRAFGLSAIAKAQASGGLIKNSVTTFGRAIETAKSISDDENRARVLSDIVEGLASAGKLTEGFQLARTIMQEPSRSNAFRRIAEAQAGVGNFAEAIQVAYSITDASERAGAFRKIVESQAKAGNIAEAIQVAHLITDKIESGTIRDYAFGAIAEAEAKAGRIDDALKHAQALRLINASEPAYSAIVTALTEAGQVSEAIHVAQSLKEDGLASTKRSSAFGAITTVLARVGKIGEALKVAQSISVDYIRAKAFGEIATAQALAGQPKDAASNFKRAIEIAHSISRSYYRAWVLEKIGEAQTKAGMAEAAGSTFDQAVQAARSIKDPYPERNSVLGEISIGQVKAGKIAKALIIIRQTMEDDSFRDTLFLQIVQIILETKAKEGEIAEAIQVAQSIKSQSDRITAFGAIAYAQAKGGLKQTAIRTLEQHLQVARSIANDTERAGTLIMIGEAWPN